MIQVGIIDGAIALVPGNPGDADLLRAVYEKIFFPDLPEEFVAEEKIEEAQHHYDYAIGFLDNSHTLLIRTSRIQTDNTNPAQCIRQLFCMNKCSMLFFQP